MIHINPRKNRRIKRPNFSTLTTNEEGIELNLEKTIWNMINKLNKQNQHGH